MKYSRNSLEQLKEIDPTTVPNPVSGEVVRGVYQGLHWTRNSAGTIVYPAPASGSANYIQNQNASAQSANMWISGSVKATNHLVSGIASRVWFDTLGVEETNWIGTENNYNLKLVCGRGSGSSLTLQEGGEILTTGTGRIFKYVGSGNDATRTTAVDVLTIQPSQGLFPYTGFGGRILFKNEIYSAGVKDAGYIGVVMGSDYDNETDFVIGLRSANVLSERVRINGSGAATFSSSVTATDFIGSSDITLKENIQVLQPKKINSNYKTFNFIGSEQARVGVIAQELEVNHPEFVRTNEEGIKSVSYSDLHSAEIAYLKDKIDRLEELVNKLMK